MTDDASRPDETKATIQRPEPARARFFEGSLTQQIRPTLDSRESPLLLVARISVAGGLTARAPEFLTGAAILHSDPKNRIIERSLGQIRFLCLSCCPPMAYQQFNTEWSQMARTWSVRAIRGLSVLASVRAEESEEPNQACCYTSATFAHRSQPRRGPP